MFSISSNELFAHISEEKVKLEIKKSLREINSYKTKTGCLFVEMNGIYSSN